MGSPYPKGAVVLSGVDPGWSLRHFSLQRTNPIYLLDIDLVSLLRRIGKVHGKFPDP